MSVPIHNKKRGIISIHQKLRFKFLYIKLIKFNNTSTEIKNCMEVEGGKEIVLSNLS